MGKEVHFPYLMTLVVLAAGIGHFTANVRAAAILNPNIINMLDVINVCPTVSFVNDSSYFSECRTTLYPNKYEGDGNVPKCMVMYDLTNRICTYQSTVINSSHKLQLPHSAKDFDALLKQLEPTPGNGEDVSDILCRSVSSLFDRLKNINVQPIEEVVSYEKQYVTKVLLNEKECKFTCHNAIEVDKFCMVLFWANNLFAPVAPVLVNSINKDKSAVVKNSSTSNVAVQTIKESLSTLGKNKGDTEITKPKVEQKEKEQIVVEPVKNPKVEISDKSKKTENLKPASIDDTKVDNANNDGKSKQTPVPAVENSDKKKPNLPSSSDKKPESKMAGNIENPIQSILQPEDNNPDEEVIHAFEEQQNKKNDDTGKDYDQALGPETGDKMNEVEKEERPLPDDDQDDSLMPYQNKQKFYSSDKEVESHVFGYFFLMTMCCIFMYIGYSNKQKILAMVLEGRRGRRGRGSRRRPSTASYRKLDSNLEEAVTSQSQPNVTHVIY